MTGPRPPRHARRLLHLLLSADLADAFAGDLDERFAARADSDPRGARLAYWRDVLSPTVLRLRKEARGMALPPGSSPRSTRGDGIVRSILSDLKFAIRSLAKSPGFTAIAVLSLALGIGPNTAIFSLVEAVLFQDWGVADPDNLIDIYSYPGEDQYFFNSLRNFELIEEGGTDVFEAVANHSLFPGRVEAENGDTEQVLGEMVTVNYFDVMGVSAELGRTFLPEEGATEGTHPVVVLGNRYWQRRYGSDPAIVGSEIRLNGRPYTVVGVAPDSFRGRFAPGVGTDFWVPLEMYPHLNPGKLNSGDFSISARVRDGVTPGQAIAAVQTIAAREDAERQALNPDRRSRFALVGVSLGSVKLHPGIDSTLTLIAALLFVAVGLVLLVACVNLAGFLLSRASSRRKEMAIRVAMGAGRGAIIRQLVVESLVLAGLGAVLGLILGQIAVRALATVRPPLPVPLQLNVDLSLPLLLFTVSTAVVAALLFGLTPALESTRAPVAATLRDEAGSSGGRKKVGARGLLVASQMALSTILLFGAALFVRSLQSASDIDLGFSERAVAVVGVESSAAEYTPDEAAAFNDELRRRLAEQPSIDNVAFTDRMPLALGTNNIAFDVPGVDPPPNANRHVLETTRVTPGYFETLGIEILEGRPFEEADQDGSVRVAILSQAAAERFWPGQSAIGKTLLPNPDGSNAITVVGVADNAKIWSLSEAPFPYMYRPAAQGEASTSFTVVASGSAPATEIAGLIRTEVASIDQDVFLTDVGTMNDHLGYIYFLPRMAALLLSLIGGLALILACIGLYGMVSYNVSTRTREMGIRLALGADRGSVVGMVLRSGLAIVAVGAFVGIVGSLGLGRVVTGFVYGTNGLDPLALLAAPLVLGAVAAVATYLPARRASGVDPVRALRSE